MYQEHPTDAFFERSDHDDIPLTPPLIMVTYRKPVNSQLACMIALFLFDPSGNVLSDVGQMARCILDRFIDTYASDLILLISQFHLLIREDIENVSHD
jgi:hypothetical protein